MKIINKLKNLLMEFFCGVLETWPCLIIGLIFVIIVFIPTLIIIWTWILIEKTDEYLIERRVIK